MNYYELLGLTQAATSEQVREAYKKLALDLHPDKNYGLDEQTQMEKSAKLCKVLKAKDVLLDPAQRRAYDDGLKRVPLCHTITLTLDELDAGVTKTLRYSPQHTQNGRVVREVETIKVHFEAGSRGGDAKIIYTKNYSRLKIIVAESEHTRFKRRGNDLTCQYTLSLYESLCATDFEMELLNGRRITLGLEEGPIRDGDAIIYDGAGMRISGNIRERGSLTVTFKVTYPEAKITGVRKALLYQALY